MLKCTTNMQYVLCTLASTLKLSNDERQSTIQVLFTFCCSVFCGVSIDGGKVPTGGLFLIRVTLTSFSPILSLTFCKNHILQYVSLRLRVQNAVSAQPCVGKIRISLVLLNFLHCKFRLWFETP